MKSVGLIIMVAILLEALVEYAKTIGKLVEEGGYKTAITQGITIALGVGLSFAFGTHLFNGCLSEVYEGLCINDNLDLLLTGILFSRGSNYFSDFIGKLTNRSSNDVIAQILALQEDGDDFIDTEDFYEVGDDSDALED